MSKENFGTSSSTAIKLMLCHLDPGSPWTHLYIQYINEQSADVCDATEV